MRSVAKFGSGWAGWRLMLPFSGQAEGESLACEYMLGPHEVPLDVQYFDEWPNKGKLHHMALVLTADHLVPQAQCFTFWDSDMVMLAPIHASTFFRNNRPMVGFHSFEETIKELPPVVNWKIAAEQALGWQVDFDFMRWFPILHLPEALKLTRARVEMNTRRDAVEYIHDQSNTFPEGFAEYNTIGAVAWRFLHEQYSWHRYRTVDELCNCPWLYPNKLVKGWAYKGFTAEEEGRFKEAGLWG